MHATRKDTIGGNCMPGLDRNKKQNSLQPIINRLLMTVFNLRRGISRAACHRVIDNVILVYVCYGRFRLYHYDLLHTA